MNILYVDDLRMPKHWENKNYKIYVARTYKDAISFLDTKKFDIIDLDHDLGEEKSGYDVIKYVIENNIQIKNVAVHTMNPVGRQNILQLVSRYMNSNIINYWQLLKILI